jgi:hypothetical protein
MRALIAAGLALFLVLTAAAPHVHSGPHGREDCAVCVARNADAAHPVTPDLEPVPVAIAAPERAPGLPPVSGAPLGAIPGQSPPRDA